MVTGLANLTLGYLNLGKMEIRGDVEFAPSLVLEGRRPCSRSIAYSASVCQQIT